MGATLKRIAYWLFKIAAGQLLRLAARQAWEWLEERWKD